MESSVCGQKSSALGCDISDISDQSNVPALARSNGSTPAWLWSLMSLMSHFAGSVVADVPGSDQIEVAAHVYSSPTVATHTSVGRPPLSR
jgi:hypothetical protein